MPAKTVTVTLKGVAVSREMILKAMQTAKLPSGWREKTGQKFVVLHELNAYPPKAIMSEASGLPVYAFSGGSDLNGKFRRLGFAVEVK